MTLGSFSFNITPGPSGVEVANVVGQTYDNGYNTLIGQQLGVNKVFQNSDTVPADTIISTDPPAGQRVGEHTTITVFVSSGAIQVSVPDLASKSEADATALLTIAKLTLGTITTANSSTIPEGMIISSDPPLGTKLPGGSLVNLVVSNGKVMVPDVRNLDLAAAQAQMKAVDVGFTVSVATPDGCQAPGTLVVDQSVLPGLAPQKSAVVLTVNCNQ
jgi:serine/threonine-protein kinase